MAGGGVAIGPGTGVQPRPQGTGFNKERKWRFIPLLEARDKSGEVCGTPACLLINRTGRLQGSCIATFALPLKACDTMTQATTSQPCGAKASIDSATSWVPRPMKSVVLSPKRAPT